MPRWHFTLNGGSLQAFKGGLPALRGFIGAGPALGDTATASSKACAVSPVFAVNQRIAEAKRLQDAPWMLCKSAAT
ncbi:hypothetical protein [Parapedobacter sp. DT-150]|uniref:hypothetical protein n=1 Tax=Parapedobacter sp. DT-150 TaxID=3396162 RepID=UPI003F541B6B